MRLLRIQSLIRRRARRDRLRAEAAELENEVLKELLAAQREWIHSRQAIDAMQGTAANRETQRLTGQI